MMLQGLKMSFYVNSHADKLLGKRNRVGYFITRGVIVWRYDVHGTVVKGNDGGGWSSDGMVL
jgi:hypothetical protein